MPSLRAAALLMLIASSISLSGCGVQVGVRDLFESDLEQFARDVDRICVESFHRGIEGEEGAEEMGEDRGWGGPRIEREIRHAWADALVDQYRRIEELGPAPERAELMERWARTSLERARLYRRVGDAWLRSTPRRVAALGTDLRIAKLMADHLAGPLPFRACGRPVSDDDDERVPPGQLVGHAPLRYTAEFPLATRGALRRVVGVYWHHRVAGRVVRSVPGSETVLVEIRIKPDFARSVIGSDLQLFRARRDPAVTWIGLVPGEA